MLKKCTIRLFPSLPQNLQVVVDIQKMREYRVHPVHLVGCELVNYNHPLLILASRELQLVQITNDWGRREGGRRVEIAKKKPYSLYWVFYGESAAMIEA